MTLLVRGNNIAVTSATLTGNTGTSVNIQFSVSWSNSWRGGGVNNWDAAWVFVKWKTLAGVWQHAYLGTTGHSVPAAGQLDLGLYRPEVPYDPTTNPVVGVLLRRSANGNGAFSLSAVQLNWNYGATGISYNDITAVQVYAVEMVYVNQGAFAAGGVGTETGKFTLTTINTGDASLAASGIGSLGGQAGGYPTGAPYPGTSLFPNGYNPFYCMKYEISSQQYVEFLNTLTYSQQAGRTATAPSSAAGTGALLSSNANRSVIDIQTPGIVASTTPAVYAVNANGNTTYGEADDGQGLACHPMNLQDVLGYLAWSGLRPMTELEFEKVCRGPLPAAPNEFPWGTAAIGSAHFSGPTGMGTVNEVPNTGYSPTAGNAVYFSTAEDIAGPMRVGAMAGAAGNTGRVTAGAGYYGAMDLGGNVREGTVDVSNQVYYGYHGTGALLSDGAADMDYWPQVNNFHARGGGYYSDVNVLRTATRSTVDYTSRVLENGGRGVRTAP